MPCVVALSCNCSLTACCSQPGVAVLVAAQGAGTGALLQKQLVLRGSNTSAGWFAAQRTLPQALYRTAATDAEALELPEVRLSKVLWCSDVAAVCCICFQPDLVVQAQQANLRC
jgi:hypothetical protein